MSLEVLLSAMHLENENYIDSLNICSNCVVVNQCDSEKEYHASHTCINKKDVTVKYIETKERGLSKSRNMAIRNATEDICILCDNDVEYIEGYEDVILKAFDDIPDADIIVFYIERPEKPVPNYPTMRRMNYLSVLKIFSPEIAFKRANLADIHFNELFGAGAKYKMGEENIFLYDALRAGKKIYYVPYKIAKLRQEESTWFSGYDREFFIARGANYGAMSRSFSHILIWQFAIRKKALYGSNVTFFDAIKIMYSGRKQYFKDIRGRK